MQTTGLIFIPDISGFTRFVKAVEIEHSRLIMQELLEILIDSNSTGLVVSEIEGDAILFYKFGERPSPNELYNQVEQMFTAFHENLLAYESRRYCQCSACLSAIDLTLKIITHYGEFTEYNIKSFNKLIGKDVILAHQLLKNDIDQHEYWLVTTGLISDPIPLDVDNKLRWVDSHKIIDGDNIRFRFAQLGYLKRDIIVQSMKKPDLINKTNVYSITMDFNTDIITLLHAAADFTYRPRWMKGVKGVEVQNHFLPRIGMRCIMILENGKSTTIANHYVFNEGEIEFSEIDESTGDLYYYILEKTKDLETRLTLKLFINRKLVSRVLFEFYRKRKLIPKIEESLQNLKRLVYEMGDAVRIKGSSQI